MVMLTNYGATLYAGFAFGESTAPAGLYLALLTVAPTSVSTGATITEPTAVDYARVQIDTLTWTTTMGDGMDIRSLDDVLTYVPAANWGTVSYFGVLDSITEGAGNLIHYGLMPTPVNFLLGQKVVIPANSISLQAV
jgi:hypothetical protein